MRILLTGVSGLLGINFAITASESHEVFGIYNNQTIISNLFFTAYIDLFDDKATNKFLKKWKPDWIVHCAALTDVNKCEEYADLAYHINVQLSKQLALLANKNNIKFLYISTDSIFDGKRDNYLETDIPTPLN